MPWWRSRRTRRASASSSVVTAPPSPVVTTLRGCSEKHAEVAGRARRPPAAARAERPGRVLDDVQAARTGELQDRRHRHGEAEQVDDAERLGARRDGGGELLGAGDVRPRRDVAEDRRRAAEQRRAGRRGEGVGRHDDLVARARCRARGRPGAAPRCRSRSPPRRPCPQRPPSARSYSASTGPSVRWRLAKTRWTAASSASPRSGRASRTWGASLIPPPGGSCTTPACARAPRRGRPAAPRTGARATW